MSFMKEETSEFDMHATNKNDSHLIDFAQHTNQSSQSSITAFLAKLWALVNDSSCDDLIAWDPSGGSFHVFDQARFAREVLPRYFKHNNFASFIRQLNMYGFRKVSTIEHGSLKTERDDIEFAHPYFIRGQESLLELIKRRAPDNPQKLNPPGGSHSTTPVPSTTVNESKTNRPTEIVRLLDDVRNLQSKQTSLNDKLAYLQTENEALWTEIGSLRQKHAKQQQIVTNIMQFLVHFIRTNSTHAHARLVEQEPLNELIATHVLRPQTASTSHHKSTIPLSLTDQGHPTNTLKRKHAAIMQGEEPNKRTITQQKQNQKLLYPVDSDQQQGITINELPDTDTSGWLSAANTIPLVDLVPSPPPVPVSLTQITDAIPPQTNEYQWLPSTNNRLFNINVPNKTNQIQQNSTFTPVAHGENLTASAHEPDFYLCSDNNVEEDKRFGHTPTITKKIMGTRPPHRDAVPSGVRPTLLKEEQNEFPKTFQSNDTNELVIGPTLNSTLYNQNPEQSQANLPLSRQISLSLDDITGDVDHIQSSLDNIREFMFDNLPESTSIDDLFGETNGLLSPLLQSTNDTSTDNLILNDLQDQHCTTNVNPTGSVDATINLSPIPNMNNQLLEQLITETAKVEEQRNTIEQLEREKTTLQDKIHMLEKQATKRK